MHENPSNAERVNAAFSAQAPLFDDIQRSSPMLEWMRSLVHRHMEEFIRPGQSLLDINAGTGIDAMHFVRRGLTVHAMDLAAGMVGQIRQKIAGEGVQDRLTTEQRSFTEAGALAPRTFDHIFSNFGGLNCVQDLRPVAAQLIAVARPGTLITMVIMPRICPWELLHLLRGNTEIALRRLHRNGVVAHIEGVHFVTYYHSVRSVLRAFAGHTELVRLRGVASLSPPPTMEKFPRRLPRTYAFLQRCDEHLNTLPPFDRWADQFILTLRCTL